jgi:hypothetical protein
MPQRVSDGQIHITMLQLLDMSLSDIVNVSYLSTHKLPDKASHDCSLTFLIRLDCFT